ncbi:hypothetical protein GUJ93_ZPchr0003g17845 [Zizania palustris]|uniref:Uncharacterized protein n=1 Tax=Zizania palustris TaxID=103762 RepID=A0A8J5S1U5_ZIZPA|nr:hypothetical protein GUJ93_ZPchr0003g17845 [Zizania palustris]
MAAGAEARGRGSAWGRRHAGAAARGAWGRRRAGAAARGHGSARAEVRGGRLGEREEEEEEEGDVAA